MLIPSVVALDERNVAPRWLIGTDAAGTSEGDGVRVFTDWKRYLFPSSEDDAQDGRLNFTDACEVAGAFLRALRDVVGKRMPEVSRYPVRLTIPQFADQSPPVDLLTGLLAGAGWRPAPNRVSLTEPATNAVGVFSRGLNATWTPPQQILRPQPKPQPRLYDMLDRRLGRAFREMRDGYAVLTTDIGAFTTDFGYIRFDSSFKDDSWSEPQVEQQSVRLGIHQLDGRIRNLFAPAIVVHLKHLPIAEWEQLKRKLYEGKSQQVVVDGNTMEMGADFEAEAIKDEIARFAEAIAKARKQFCADAGITAIDIEAITGGGSTIEALRSKLVGVAYEMGRPVLDLNAADEPEQATAAGAGRFTPAESDQRKTKNRMLVRCASAVGGVSVFFE